MAKTTYDKNTDYQALINQAIQSGNAGLARQYEAQRNAKITDMNTQGTKYRRISANELLSAS